VSQLEVAGSTVGFLLLASSQQGLQLVLDRFSAACEQAGMKISTGKTGFHQSRRHGGFGELSPPQSSTPQIEI